MNRRTILALTTALFAAVGAAQAQESVKIGMVAELSGAGGQLAPQAPGSV